MSSFIENRPGPHIPRIFIFGERAIKSSPSFTLSHLLQQTGYDVTLGTLPDTTVACINQFRLYDHVVYIDYGKPSDWVIQQIALAGIVNTPVIRWWVGTDVYNLLHDTTTAQQAQRLDKFIESNVAVSSHLAAELESVGIKAVVVPIVPPQLPHLSAEWLNQTVHHVLVYLPTEKDDFYGADILDEVIPQNPDIVFTLLRNDGKRFNHLKNVVSVEWIENMDQVYQQNGCLLRCTRHDGLPRMVLEALARGKYVIYSWPLEGCILARTPSEVNAALRQTIRQTKINHSGAEIVRSAYNLNAFKSSCSPIFFSDSPLRRLSRKLRAVPLGAAVGFRRAIKKICK